MGFAGDAHTLESVAIGLAELPDRPERARAARTDADREATVAHLRALLEQAPDER